MQEDGKIVAVNSRDKNLTDNNSDEEWEDNRATIDVIQEIDEFDSERNLLTNVRYILNFVLCY